MGKENNSGKGTSKDEMPKNKVPNNQILSGKISSEKISDDEVSSGQIFDGKILGDEILNGGDSDYCGEIVPAERVRGIFDRRKSGNKKMQILNFCREKETGEWQCKSLRH
ncbi:MAG: hypothetical protein LBI69_02425, partial [Puniceicoccales bacterium]|nr:hypothetical protein [Puniceicoccales bacterium]